MNPGAFDALLLLIDRITRWLFLVRIFERFTS